MGKVAPLTTENLQPFATGCGVGLVVLPIRRDLRYLIPPWTDDHIQALRATLRPVPGVLHVYADDMEKSVQIGPWRERPWRREFLAPYERLLSWLSQHRHVQGVLISRELEGVTALGSREVGHGTYFELAQGLNAGEDYRAWWDSPSWRPYRRWLEEAERVLLRRPMVCRKGLWDLAWKQLMACSYETAWHDLNTDTEPRPAPWAAALACHARSVFAIAAVAAAPPLDHPLVQQLDIDRDGQDEVILWNSFLCAVITPRYGGRLIYLFDLEAEKLIVGNPADDWHWEQEQNAYTSDPHNHPGAFADAGHENERYMVHTIDGRPDSAGVRLINSDANSRIFGCTKYYQLLHGSRCLTVTYQTTARAHGVEICLSPDYLELLRLGKRQLSAFTDGRRRGWACVELAVYIECDDHTEWTSLGRAECGHGLILFAESRRNRFRFEIGVARLDADPKRVLPGGADG